LMPSWTS